MGLTQCPLTQYFLDFRPCLRGPCRDVKAEFYCVVLRTDSHREMGRNPGDVGLSVTNNPQTQQLNMYFQ